MTPIPTNLEYQAFGDNAALIEVKARDDENYQYSYYARRGDGSEPVFYRRKDFPDMIFRTVESKLRALVGEIVRYHVLGRPMLVGTTSVESSERLSNVAIIAILAAIAIPQLCAHRTKSYNTTAVSALKNAAIAHDAYYVRNRQYTNSNSALTTAPYNGSISQGVRIAVSSANNEAYLMTAYHSAGNSTYTLSGPGGTVSP